MQKDFRAQVQSRKPQSPICIARGNVIVPEIAKASNELVEVFYGDVGFVEREELRFDGYVEVGFMLYEVIICSHIAKRGPDKSLRRVSLLHTGCET